MSRDAGLRSLPMEVAGKTDIGRVRTNNEDCFGYDAALGIFVLCDGMGGEAAGEVASELGVSSVLSFFRQAAGRGEYPASESLAAVSGRRQCPGQRFAGGESGDS